MSGGRFNYQQSGIRDIYEQIAEELSMQGDTKEDATSPYRIEFYEKYPEEKYNRIYPEEIQQAMRDGVEVLKKAYVYAQRIDWFLSGDDGDENFLKRLKDDLNEL